MTTLLWMTGLFFAALLPWGTNVPITGRVMLVKVFVVLNIAIHMVTQGFIHQSHTSEWSSQETRAASADNQSRLERYIDVVAITPAKLEQQGGWRWAQLVTANFIHGGWLHLVMNMWIFALYGQNLESLFGRYRFLLFVLAAMLGSQCAVLLFTQNSPAYDKPHAGFSGVVYAVMAAYLVCFPRSKVKVALIYDLKFWAAVVFILLPVIFIFSSGSPSFAELLLVLGLVVLFALIQPEHARFSIPAFVLLGYKLLQDALSFDRQIEEFSISVWSHAGGLMVGTIGGLLVHGTKGLHTTYDDPDALGSGRKGKRPKVNLAQLEAAAQTDPEAARTFLGQRVFVGDAVRATKFYSEVVMTKFPEMQLDPRELHSLARMLEFKGMDAVALDAYERLLRCHPLPPGYASAWMQAARLCAQVAPERAVDCLRYLQHFEDESALMRDKFEARRLRAEVLDAAKARGMDPAQLEAEASGTPGGSAPASGATAHLSSGEGCELDRRLPMRSGSRMQQIAPLAADGGANVVTATEVEKASEVEMEKVGAHESTLPAVELTRKGSAFALPPPIPLADLTPSPNAGEVPPAEPLPAELPLEPPPPPSDVPQGLPGWGKRPLPLKFRDKALEIARARLEEKPVPSPPRPPSPDLPKDAPPPLPSALEQRLGLRSRPPRVDLSNLPDERKHTD